MFFSNLFLLYKLDIFWLECEKDEKPKVHFRTPLIQKINKCNISSTYIDLIKGLRTLFEFEWMYLNLL